jgi:AraC-like DNA-binding protein
MALLRRGGFNLRVHGKDHFVDPTTAYFHPPWVEHLISHPADAGDDTTAFVFSEPAIVRFAGDGVLPKGPIRTTPQVDFLHRSLVAGLLRGMERFELEEHLARTVAAVVEAAAPGRLTSRRPQTETAHLRIVDHVREAVSADPVGITLGTLADQLGRSRFHVSRVFHQMTGVTMTQHRNRLRLALALERLMAGESDLAGLAADLGFADQSHLARLMRGAVGAPPGRVRDSMTGISHPDDRLDGSGALNNQIQDLTAWTA